MSTSPAPHGPLLERRARWRLGWVALAVAALLLLVALLRPLRAATSPQVRLAVTLALGLGVAATALLASLRGRGAGERLAFLTFLILALDGLGQVLAPFGWPIWPVMAVLVAALAVAEPLRIALGAAACATLLGTADALWANGLAGWRTAIVLAFAYGGLAAVLDRALAGEKHRLASTLAEIARLTHGVDQLEEGDATASGFNTAALTLRQVSGDARRARQSDRAGHLDDALGRIVRLARRALVAHSVAYFEVDHERGCAYARAADGPAALTKNGTLALNQDPLAFVLERRQAFYATDFKRLLWSLPYYQAEVRVGTLLAVPVYAGPSISGVLLADRLETQAFTGSEPELLTSFADVATHTIVDAKVAVDREELGAEFKAVYEVSRRMAMQIDPAPVRHLLLRSARDLVTLEAAAVIAVDESQTRYTVEDASGWAKEYVGREVALTERSWTAWVLRSAEEPYLLDDMAVGSERMPLLVLDEPGGRSESLLAIPLRVRNRTLGALILTAPPRGFDAASRRVLGILANQAAAALHTMRLVERAKDQALRDGLTDLYNRRAFDDLLAKSLAREQRQGGRLGLVFVDLDHFKKLNDTYGHPAGDAALRATAVVLERQLRKGDHAARYGGEEFAVILPGADEAGTLRIAERIREAIEKERLLFEGARITCTASLGVAVSPTDAETDEGLLAAADRALYAAKHAGRNRVVAASSAASEAAAGPTSS